MQNILGNIISITNISNDLSYYYSTSNTTGLYYESGMLFKVFFLAVHPIVLPTSNFTYSGPIQSITKY